MVGRQGHALFLLQQVPHIEEGLPHADAQGLGLLAVRNAAAVVVGQRHHQPVPESVVEHPLATHVEVVGINQGKGRLAGGWEETDGHVGFQNVVTLIGL